jgi:hypothetical protein
MTTDGANRLCVYDYTGRWGDAGIMNDLARTLRTYPEEDRFRFIYAALVGESASVGHVLDLANRCLRTPRYCVLLFEYCLVHLGWRWMQTSLLHLLPRLGYRRTIAVLVRVLHTDPHTLRNIREARYELPYVVQMAHLRIQPTALYQALDALDRAIASWCPPS